jgi:4-amino-4-deoxy-L-arabinose transferase-like glycosyltransferase
VPAGARAAVIVLFAALAAPVLWFLHPVGDYFVETDFYGGYAPGVHALWAHGLDPSRYGVVGPVYELVLALLGLSGLDLFRLAQALSLVATLATLALWSQWFAGRFGRGAGWIAALLIASNPTVFRYSYTASTDALFVALASAAFVCLFPRTPRRGALAAAGALAGLATLTRYTGIVLVPLGVLATVWPWGMSPWRGRRVRSTAVFLLAVLAVLGPWWVVVTMKGAPPTLRFYHNLAYEVYARARGLTWDEYQVHLEEEFPTLGAVLAKDPAAVVTRLALNSGEHLAQSARELWLWPLSALAAAGFGLWLARRLGGAGPPLGFGLSVYLALVPAFYSSRYHLPLVPVAGGLAAAALAAPRALPDLLRRARFGVMTGAVLALVLAGATAYAVRSTVRETRYLATQEPLELPAIGAALRRDWKGAGRPRLLARKPHLSYYAGAEPVAFVALDSLESLVRYVHEQRVDYVFISWPEAQLRPAFAFLLMPEFAPAGLDLVFSQPDHRAALYRVTPAFGSRLPDWYPVEWPWRTAEGMVHVRPDAAEVWLAAGEGRHARKDYDGAFEAFRMALQLKPGWGPALYSLGTLQADRGDFAGAVDSYNAALAAGVTLPQLYRNLGFARLQLGDLAGADQMLTRYLATTDDPRVAQLLARLRAGGAAAPGR